MASLLLVLGVLLAGGACVKSATYDEWSYLAGGIHFLKTGQNDIHVVAPAGIKAWIALPTRLILNPELPQPHDLYPWTYGDRFRDQLAEPDLALFLARLPIMTLTLFLALAAYAFARMLWGKRAGLLALAVVVFEPNLLAHGRVADGDLALAALGLGALACLWRHLQSGRRRWLAASALLFALTMETKYVGAALLPMGALALVVARLSAERSLRSLRTALGSALLLVAATAVAYSALILLLHGGPSPVINGYRQVFKHVSEANPPFLFGRVTAAGSWYYFPVVWLVKTPLPILIALSTLPWIVRRHRHRVGLAFLAVPAVAWFLLATTGTVCLGIRHILIVVAAGAVAVSAPAATASTVGRPLVRRAAIGVLTAWLAIGTLVAFPDYLAYFNAAARTVAPRHRMVIGSSLDWGQDLPALAGWLEARGNPPIQMIYFGRDDPRRFGIDAQCFTPYVAADQLAPGLLAVSATYRAIAMARPDLERRLANADQLATLGGSILVFRLRAEGEPSR